MNKINLRTGMNPQEKFAIYHVPENLNSTSVVRGTNFQINTGRRHTRANIFQRRNFLAMATCKHQLQAETRSKNIRKDDERKTNLRSHPCTGIIVPLGFNNINVDVFDNLYILIIICRTRTPNEDRSLMIRYSQVSPLHNINFFTLPTLLMIS